MLARGTRARHPVLLIICEAIRRRSPSAGRFICRDSAKAANGITAERIVLSFSLRWSPVGVTITVREAAWYPEQRNGRVISGTSYLLTAVGCQQLLLHSL